MLSWFFKVVRFLVESVYTHAASVEGKLQLTEILDEIEASGFDVPFYEPSQQGPSGEQGGQGDIGTQESAQYDEPYPTSTRRRIIPKDGE